MLRGSLLVCCQLQFRMSKTVPESLPEPLRANHSNTTVYKVIEVATTCQPLSCYVSITPLGYSQFRAIFQQRRRRVSIYMVQDGAGRTVQPLPGITGRGWNAGEPRAAVGSGHGSTPASAPEMPSVTPLELRGESKGRKRRIWLRIDR